MGVIETYTIMVAVAGSAVLVAYLLLARSGYIVSPKQADSIAPQIAHETELVREIGQIGEEFTADFWHRYHELITLRDNESLVPDGPEHVELIGMTDTLEEWNARRMGLLFELARIRKTPIDDVLREFRPLVVNRG
jgi:hypothetical protein